MYQSKKYLGHEGVIYPSRVSTKSLLPSILELKLFFLWTVLYYNIRTAQYPVSYRAKYNYFKNKDNPWSCHNSTTLHQLYPVTRAAQLCQASCSYGLLMRRTWTLLSKLIRIFFSVLSTFRYQHNPKFSNTLFKYFQSINSALNTGFM